jgi:hypothetical protein
VASSLRSRQRSLVPGSENLENYKRSSPPIGNSAARDRGLANAATEHVQAWDLLQQGSNGLAHLLASVSGFDFGTAPIEDVTQIGAGQEDHQASNDTMVCEEPIESVCDVDDQTVGVAQEVCEIEKEVCEIEPASRPLDQVMSEAMKARGADQDAITAAWTEVQRGSAAAYGDYFNAIGEAQRDIYKMLDNADLVSSISPALGSALRATAAQTLQLKMDVIRGQVIDSVVTSAMCNLGSEQCEVDPCLESQLRAQVEAQFAAQAFQPSQISGSSQDIRFAFTTGLDGQRLAVQRALEGMSGTTFQPYIRGDATGLQMTMMTQSDYGAQVKKDEATGMAQVDAGHLHATGVAANGNTANENMQIMLRDMYTIQSTSNVGRTLTEQLVAGTGQQFDTRFVADNLSADVDGDSFLNDRVDVHDLHDPGMVPNRVATPGARGPIDVQSTGSAYVHFMAERQDDAQNNPTDTATIQANDAALLRQSQVLDGQRLALLASLAKLAPAEQASIQAGGGATTPDGRVFLAAAVAWNTAFATWQANQQAHLASFNNRFNQAHAHGLASENAYNREQGLVPTTRP